MLDSLHAAVQPWRSDKTPLGLDILISDNPHLGGVPQEAQVRKM